MQKVPTRVGPEHLPPLLRLFMRIPSLLQILRTSPAAFSLGDCHGYSWFVHLGRFLEGPGVRNELDAALLVDDTYPVLLAEFVTAFAWSLFLLLIVSAYRLKLHRLPIFPALRLRHIRSG